MIMLPDHVRCPCESGKPFRLCHGAPSTLPIPDSALYEMAQKAGKRADWRRRYGHLREPISGVLGGHRLVCVNRKRFHLPASLSFEAFLAKYPATLLGQAWGRAQETKPLEERHPLLQWKSHIASERPPEKYPATASGYRTAFMSFAYDLYTLDDADALPGRKLKLLRMIEQFQGARYEVATAAACVRAGFAVEWIKGGAIKSCDFVARHRETQKPFSVEVRSRHRHGYLGMDGKPKDQRELRADIRDLVFRALKKQAEHERIIMIDVNLPALGERTLEELAGQLADLEKDLPSSPPAIIFFTNRPDHFTAHHDSGPGAGVMLAGIRRPDVRATNFGLPPVGDNRLHSLPQGIGRIMQTAIQRKAPEVAALMSSLIRHRQWPHAFPER